MTTILFHFHTIAMKQGKKYTKQMDSITVKRTRQINDYIKKSARFIVNYCLENKIGRLVVGYNKDFKRSINIGKKK